MCAPLPSCAPAEPARWEEQALRAKAREVLDTGKLPAGRPDRVRGEPGVGAPCAVCDLPVQSDQVEFELEFACNADDPDKYHVHIRCLAAWEFERRGVRAAGASMNVLVFSIPGHPDWRWRIVDDDSKTVEDSCPSPKRRPSGWLAREHPRSAAKTVSQIGPPI